MNELIEIISCNSIVIIGLLGAVIFWSFMNKSHVTQKDKTISLIVYRNGQQKTFLICAYFISLASISIDTIIYWFRYISEFQFFAYFVVLLLIIAFAIIYLLKYYFDYISVDDNNIIYHRVLKKSIYTKLTSILEITLKKTKLIILNKDKQAIAIFPINSLNSNKLVKLLYENYKSKVADNILSYYHINPTDKNEQIKPELKNKYSKNQIKAYTLIGKEFRKNEKQNKRKDIFKFFLFQIIFASIILGFVLISHNYLLIILFGVNIYAIITKTEEYKHKYNSFDYSDFDLGLKYAYQCSKVMGYHRNKKKSIKRQCLMLSIIAAVITAFNGYLTYTSKPLDYDDTSIVIGELVEIKYNHLIDLKIKDDKDIYKDYRFTIPNSFYKYIDKESLISEEIGQEVEMKVTTNHKEGTILYLAIGEDIYVNQDTLNKDYESHVYKQQIIFYSLISITIAIILGSLGYEWYLDSNIKKETIDLND